MSPASLTKTAMRAKKKAEQIKKRIPFVMYTNAISFDQKTRDLVKYHRIASPHLGHERYILENIYNEKTMGQDF